MKILLSIISLLCLSLACEAGCCCCSDSPKSAMAEKKKEVVFITKEDVQKMIREKGVVLIDVLSPESYAKGHIKGAINIPLSNLEKNMEALKKYDKIIVYCASKKCHASVKAAKLLIKHGFGNVYDYKNGLKEWIESGLPLSVPKG